MNISILFLEIRKQNQTMVPLRRRTQHRKTRGVLRVITEPGDREVRTSHMSNLQDHNHMGKGRYGSTHER